jgi:hypothetical protein
MKKYDLVGFGETTGFIDIHVVVERARISQLEEDGRSLQFDVMTSQYHFR